MRARSGEWWSALPVAFAFLALVAGLPARIVSDTFFVLNGGRLVAEDGLPHGNALTVIGAGREWVDQQWLAHLLLYELERAAGLVAVAALAALATAGAVALLVAALRRAGLAALRTAALGAVALLELLPYASARSQVLTLPLFVWVLVLAERARRRPRAAWAALPVLVVWANLHGSVLVGVGVMLAWALAGIVSERGVPFVGRLAGFAPGLLAPLALLVTPYGPAGVTYYARIFGGAPLREVVSEWQPASLAEPLHAPFFALLLPTLVLLGANRRRVELRHWLIVGGLAVAGLWSIRFGVFFALAALYVLGLLWAQSPMGPPRPVPRPLPALVLGAALAGIGLLAVAGAGGEARLVERTAMPVAAGGALDRLARTPGARVLADDQTANYVLWTHPRLAGRVALDSRLELLRAGELRAFARFLGAGAGWQRFARGYRAILVVPMIHPQIAAALRRAAGWRVTLDRPEALLAERAG